MILTSQQILAKAIVTVGDAPAQASARATTYDATVGEIITGGKTISSQSYTLRPRGLVWVVSRETFKIPHDVTGLATLKTSWTHDGVLALTLGIVDPGWDGPLATAIVNFSREEFEIEKGKPFFRLLFMNHEATTPKPERKSVEQYTKQVEKLTKSFSNTFLTIDSLAPELSEKIFGFISPKLTMRIGLIALVIAILSVTVPVAWLSVPPIYNSLQKDNAKVDSLLENHKLHTSEINTLKERTLKIGTQDEKLHEIEAQYRALARKIDELTSKTKPSPGAR
ncbi:hypothetical protein FNB15_11275 [Ferrovibrio terrae]|uniref:Uncharacterized protein n=1 Tax=Ferrovibrio terrae TaxID=2594003 RepID=A0A516H216_9PROT|nr:hypothetical protein [Ferrovibrio terrae]QDO97812.1 hypothetical protein FNB15_11275 [Ferrovibrio terrae]